MLAGDLYHSVGKWKPVGDTTFDGITPGRIGEVHFSPETSMNFLETRGPNWCTQTHGGKFPNALHKF